MGRIKRDLTLAMIDMVDIMLVTMIFGAFWFGFYAQTVYGSTAFWGNWCILALFSAIYYLLCRAYNGFEIALQGIYETIYSKALALLITNTILYCVTCLLERKAADLWPMLAVFVVCGFEATLWSILKKKWFFWAFLPKRSVIVYDEYTDVGDLIEQYGLAGSFEVVAAIEVKKCLRDMSALDNAEVVFLSNVGSGDRNEILKYCVERDVEVYMTPRIGDTLMRGARQVRLFHLPVLRVGRYHPSPAYLFLKRSFDILASTLSLLILSPVFLVTAILIKADDGGPVFYTQERLTKDGRIFRIHKFRSMCVDAEKDGIARLSTGEQDERVTSVGRVIRKTRIDELPQLLDILRGDLSVVGPRPERPEIAEQYEQIMPEFRLRLQAKAGLTGYAQVCGKYNTRPYDKLKMDLMYISHPSIIEDLRICFATVKILFMPASTEGVAEGQITAADESFHQKESAERETMPLEKGVYAK